MDKKYCTNCGYQNEDNSEFCINCGYRFNNETSVVERVQKPKKKKGKGLIITLIILLIIAGLIFGGVKLYKKLTFFEDPFPDIDELATEKKSLVGALNDDLESGKITKDQYIKELAYAIKEPVLVNENYSNTTNDFNDMNYLFDRANEMANDLSSETVEYLFNIFIMKDVVWDVEDEVLYEEDSIYDYKVQTVKSTNGKSLNKLDHVKLSRKGNFLVYYSTDGRNAISNSKAKKIADYLEDVVSYYKSEYGYDYKYEAVANPINLDAYDLFSKFSKSKAESLLKKNDIDKKYLDTAMPIYIIDTDYDKTGLLGWNCETMKLGDQLTAKAVDVFYDELKLDTARATYAFPYTVISTSAFDDFNDAKFVVAHETFHHYQHYICGNGNYARCSSGLFTVETTADLSGLKASKIKKNVSTSNGHALWYVWGVEQSLDKIQYYKYGAASIGYPTFIFAYNYSEIVPNGNEKLHKSGMVTNALSYLKENSNNKYNDVLLTLAEKNLTHDYKNKALIPYDDNKPVNPKGHLPVSMNILRNETVNYSAMHYYYFDPWYVKDALDHTQIKFESSSDDLYLLLFVKEKGSYKKVYTQRLNNRFVIDVKDFVNYEELAFAVVNTSVTNGSNYVLSTGGNDEITVSPETLGLKLPKEDKKRVALTSSLVCYQIEEEAEYKTITQVRLDFDNNDEVEDMYARATIQMKNYDPNDPAFKIAKNFVSGLIFLMRGQLKEQLGSVSFRTKDLGDRYSITARVRRDYYAAIKGSFNTEARGREDLYNVIQSEGYICEFK